MRLSYGADASGTFSRGREDATYSPNNRIISVSGPEKDGRLIAEKAHLAELATAA
jgi:hypothetical protein